MNINKKNDKAVNKTNETNEEIQIEDTGEAKKLDVNKFRMGDRVIQKNPINKKKNINKNEKTCLSNQTTNILNTGNLYYKPSTKESKEAYSSIIQIMNYIIPEQGSENLIKIVDEILVLIFKNEDSTYEKYNSLKSFFSTESLFTRELFDKILNLSLKINDFYRGNEGRYNQDNIINLDLDEKSFNEEDNNINEINKENDIENEENEENNEKNSKSSSDDNDNDNSSSYNDDIMYDINNDDDLSGSIDEEGEEEDNDKFKNKEYLRMINERKGHLRQDKTIYKKTYENINNIKVKESINYDIYTILPKNNETNSNIKELHICDVLQPWMYPAFQYEKDNGEVDFIVEYLNKVQSSILKTALKSDSSFLVCAPTSSGKTNIAMLSLLKLLSNNYNESENKFNYKNIKALIITPMKALASETVGNFSKRLSKYGISVSELSGDANMTRIEMENTNIIVSTPEKWDVISRKIAMRNIIESVKLIIIDEIHLLHDSRGPVLESIISKINRYNKSIDELNQIRIVGLSATMPNYKDIGEFLRISNENIFYFDDSYRPVPLEYNFISIKEKSIIKKNQLSNEITYSLVKERIENKQILIFVHSRRDTSKTGLMLKSLFEKDNFSILSENENKQLQQILHIEKENISNNDLLQLVSFGIGIHHAGLSKNEKEVVENLFNEGYLKILVSTATLAWGVNLPAHAVIIKGTQIYSPENGGWIELSIQDVLQMMGRAGRVGYSSINNIGEGFIITSNKEINYYLSIFNQQMPIESQLYKSIPECINAEIVLKSITSIKECMEWIKNTYLYIRMRKNPELYGISKEILKNDTELKSIRKEISIKVLKMLEDNEMIIMNKKEGSLDKDYYIESTQLGIISSYYYLRLESISIYSKNLNIHMNQIDILKIFSQSEEFKYISIKEEERFEVEDLFYKVPIPVKGTVEDNITKVNILLQAYISRIPLDNYIIMSDMIYISQNAERIFHALYEICLKKGWSSITQICLSYIKMISKRMWSAQTPLRQFSIYKNISEEIIISIEKREKLTWDRFLNMTSHEIGEILTVENRDKAGYLISEILKCFPRIEIEPNIQPLTNNTILIEVLIKRSFIWNEKIHGKQEDFLFLVEDNNSEYILHYEIISFNRSIDELLIRFILPIEEIIHPFYFLKIISEKWIKSELIMPISLSGIHLPSKFEQEDKEEIEEVKEFSLPINVIFKSQMDVDLFIKSNYNVEELSCNQTKLFLKLVKNINVSFLICSGNGYGKGLLVMILLIIKLISKKVIFDNSKKDNKMSNLKIIYISPIEKSLYNEYNIYKKLEKLGVKVGILTGQSANDMIELSSCHIIFSSVENYDKALKRHFQIINSAETIIFEYINLIMKDSLYEIVITRTRYLKSDFQIIAIGDSCSNYYNISDWMGINRKFSFNIKSDLKSNKIIVNINGFDQHSKIGRINTINQSILSVLERNLIEGKFKTGFIISQNKDEAVKLSFEIVSYFNRKNLSFMTDNSLSKRTYSINDNYIMELIPFGISLFYESLDDIDKQQVLDLYNNQNISLVIISHNSLYDFNAKSKLILIQDTMKYDHSLEIYDTYSTHDVNLIISKGSYYSTQEVPSEIHIYCPNWKKSYYKKFLFDGFPLESSLNYNFPNHLNSEICRGVIKDKQTCMDWFTWTFFYIRLYQNPNYYQCNSKSQSDVMEYLSELIDNSFAELINSGCILYNEESSLNIVSLNYGKISNMYSISYETIDLFSKEIQSNRGLFKNYSQIVKLLSSSIEIKSINFPYISVENLILLNDKVKYKFDNLIVDLNDNHIKSNLLLQSYLNRIPVSNVIVNQYKLILPVYFNLSSSLVDMLSSNGFLEESLILATLNEMIFQGMIFNKSNLLQLPHFTSERVDLCERNNIKSIIDFLKADHNIRELVLKGFDSSQINQIANICNLFPIYEVEYKILSNTNKEKFIYKVNEELVFHIKIIRDSDISIVPMLKTEYFPYKKEESWWVIIGNRKENQIMSIKKISFLKEREIEMKFTIPSIGEYQFSIILISDCWIGSYYEEECSEEIVVN